MALPSSGTITMNDIRVELGMPSQTGFSLDIARSGGYVTLNGCSPHLPPSSGTVGLSDWYNYCHTCNKFTTRVSFNGVSYYYGTVSMDIYRNGTLYATRGYANGNYNQIIMSNVLQAGNTVRIVVYGTPTSGGAITKVAYSIDGIEYDCTGSLDTGNITISCGHDYVFYNQVTEAPPPGHHNVSITPQALLIGYDGTGDRYTVWFTASENVGTTITIYWSYRAAGGGGGGGSWSMGNPVTMYSGSSTSSTDSYSATVSIAQDVEIQINSISPSTDGVTQDYVG
jgi:hypothetical protein